MKTLSTFTLSIFLVLTSLVACSSKEDPSHKYDPSKYESPDDTLFNGLERLIFSEAYGDVLNPERGFYYPFEWHNPGDPIKAEAVKAKVREGYTLLLYEFYLTKYMESDIADDYLETVRDCFSALREGGAKCVLRFAYKQNESDSNKPWDASEEWVLRHIQQLKPLFQEYADVIYVLQAGFVGVWGEWYYTDHFNMNPTTEEQYAPRKHVVEALLDALPETRQIELRTPMFKEKLFNWILKDTLTAQTAHNGSIKARIGGHNDCFVASRDDYGTYAMGTDRKYWMADTKYTIMGGETCNDDGTYCKCDNSLKELAAYHWSYLNIAYNQKVLNRWKTEGCFDEAKMRLGYRLIMTDAYVSPERKAGETIRVGLKIRNDGFASPMNPRGIELIVVANNGEETVYPLKDVNPQTWYNDITSIVDAEIKLPSNLSGSFDLYLNLPDPEPTLKNKPGFSIQLANADTWNSATGYNHIGSFTVTE